jgi:hypothetical protein
LCSHRSMHISHGCCLEEAQCASAGVVAHRRRHLPLRLHFVLLLQLCVVALLSNLLWDTEYVLEQYIIILRVFHFLNVQDCSYFIDTEQELQPS